MKDMALRLSRFLLYFAFGVFVYLVYLMAFPFKVLEVNRLPFPVLNPQVEAGNPVILDFDYCKYVSSPASYYVQFIEQPSGVIITLEGKYISNVDRGCHRGGFEVYTPENMDAGIYKVKLNAVYHLNFIRDIYYTFESEDFEVVRGSSLHNKLDEILSILEDYELVKD